MSKLSACVTLKFDNLPKLLEQINYVLCPNAWKAAFRANRWWSFASGKLKKPTVKGKVETSSSDSTSSSESEITVDDWEGGSQCSDHSILPNNSTLDTAANAW